MERDVAHVYRFFIPDMLKMSANTYRNEKPVNVWDVPIYGKKGAMSVIQIAAEALRDDEIQAAGLGEQYCRELERGNILILSEIPFPFSPEDRQFLLTQRQTSASYHKNIAYRVKEDKVTGFAASSASDSERLQRILGDYSRNVIRWLERMAPFYAHHWRIDCASFRPLDEEGRLLSQRSRNDLLHVDAFPGRPTNGDRILRFFTNIHPTRPRVWVTGEAFDQIAPELAIAAGLPRVNSARDPQKILADAGLQESWSELLQRAVQRCTGHPVRTRAPYDRFMLRFHDYLKANGRYQRECKKYRHEFPPNSCWIVFTDMVPHSVLSGQFALEMTFIISRASLLLPEMAPVRILERISGLSLTLPETNG